MAINCEIVKQLIAICIQTDEPVNYSYQYTQVRPHKIEIWNNGSQAKFPNKRWGWVAAFFFFIGNKVDERGIFQKINIGNLRFQKDIHVSCEMSVNVNCWCNLVHYNHSVCTM